MSLLWLLLWLGNSGFAVAQSVQKFTPVDDASVYIGNTGANYGTADLLVKDRPSGGITRLAYLKFDISAYSLSKTGAATLRLYCRTTQASTPATIDVFSVADNSWNESTLTWSTKPAMGTKIGSATVNSAGKYYEWDISEYVRSLNPSSSSNTILSVVLSDQSKADNTITFNAKENTANHPELILNESSSLFNGIYYVDSENGNDSNDGLAINSAWKTLAKVNTITFSPGAKILLKSGGMWTGQLRPQGSGSAFKPIIVDKYGDGAKPLINGNGIIAEGVVLLSNQSYWEISNLEITNDALENAERRGVEINASNYGTVEHIYLKNLEVHDIKGTVGNTDDDKRSAGIYFTVVDDSTVPTRFNNILVEGCQIYNCQNEGIVTNNNIKVNDYPGTLDWERRKYTNLIIRNNTIHHISKNAMIIRLADGGLVERNLCYETATGTQGNTIFSRSSRGTVFQYNEGYLNRSAGADGSLYDPDLSSPGTIWQYSYSHDNAHGLVWFCTDEKDDNIKVRYNISQNDKGNLVYFNYPLAGAEVYNNVFYIGTGLSPFIIREKSSESHTYTFANNIVYNSGVSPSFSFATNTATSFQVRTVQKNIFYNLSLPVQISAAVNSTQNPMFINPGSGGIGLGSVNGYKLKPGSPALGAGMLIADNGGKDYFGLAVSKTANPNIGFYNGPGITITAPDPKFHLYNLIGQSNMAGRGVVTAEYASVGHPRVLMLNKENQWVQAKYPLHFDNTAAGVSLGLPFAIKMAEADPTITIGLIPSAVGGTTIADWGEGALDASSGTYPYDAALSRAKAAMQYGVMKGILFHQGESNRTSSYSTWPDSLKKLIYKLRNEFENPKIPVIIGELGYFLTNGSGVYNAENINKLLPQIVAEVPFTAMVSAQGLTHKGDDLHFDSPSLTLFGERYAEQMKLVQTQVLPVRFLDFSLSKSASAVKIMWKTASEANNDYFEAERSADGRHFLSLGIIKGAGSSSDIRSYQFEDRSPLSGNNYYRIKQVDFDKVSSYTAVKVLNFQLAEDLLLGVYPNPTSTQLSIKYNSEKEEPLIVTIYGIRGQLIESRFSVLPEGIIDVSTLQPGIYIMKVQKAANREILGNIRFIKQ